jgi:hypothetical protein
MLSGARAFATAFGAAALVLLDADDLRRSTLTPWSATCYPTRSVERVSSGQAEYERLAGHSLPAIQIKGARRFASRYQALGLPKQMGHALAFGGAIYLSLGRRQRSATLQSQMWSEGASKAQRAGRARGVCVRRRDPLRRALSSSIRASISERRSRLLHRRAKALRCLHVARATRTRR